MRRLRDWLVQRQAEALVDRWVAAYQTESQRILGLLDLQLRQAGRGMEPQYVWQAHESAVNAANHRLDPNGHARADGRFVRLLHALERDQLRLLAARWDVPWTSMIRYMEEEAGRRELFARFRDEVETRGRDDR